DHLLAPFGVAVLLEGIDIDHAVAAVPGAPPLQPDQLPIELPGRDLGRHQADRRAEHVDATIPVERPGRGLGRGGRGRDQRGAGGRRPARGGGRQGGSGRQRRGGPGGRERRRQRGGRDGRWGGGGQRRGGGHVGQQLAPAVAE